ncbi:MAG: GH25 family lysozyme [Albidovulum sp.]|jgi:lysozyme
MKRALATLCAAAILLAACGGGAKMHRLPVASGIPGTFGDSDPHDWQGRAPVNYPVHGIDVSRWQGDINWPVVSRASIAFAYLKATEGGDHIDPRFKDHWRGARRAGLPRGAYHFFYFCTPAAQQARWYIRNVPREAGSLPPVLDIEWNHTSRTCRTRPDAKTVRAEIRTFQRIVAAHYGQRPVIYTTVDFWQANDLALLGGEEFWLRSVAGHPSKVFPGARWSFWQYTGTGVVPGIGTSVDINAFAGSPEAWASWLARRQL